MFISIKRNSAVSLCQTFARMGAVIAPNVQLLVIYLLLFFTYDILIQYKKFSI